MPGQTNRFGLPLLESAQAQKEITHNEALHRIDRTLGRCFQSRNLQAAPNAPQIDEAWIVPEDAAGEWQGHEGEIAEWDGAGWQFTSPPPGALGWVEDEDALVLCGANGWAAGLPVAGLTVGGRTMLGGTAPVIAAPQGGTIVDEEARAAISALIEGLQAMGLSHA